MSMKIVMAGACIAALVACATPHQQRRETREPPTLVQATCAGCHAIVPGHRSPIAEAPTFEDIANLPGFTRKTLIVFLADTHNYPDIMDVDLDREDIELIADYMLTLRRDDYRRFPS